jgi:uncharacterized delta-60 repeat protein
VSSTLETYGKEQKVIGGVHVGDGVWHHVAMTWEANNFHRVYVDGFLVNGNSLGFTPNPDQQVTNIGKPGKNNRYMGGSLDEVRIFSRPLSSEEIKASYNNGLHRLYHNFTGLSDGVYDYSANAIDTEGNLIIDKRSVFVEHDKKILIQLIGPEINMDAQIVSHVLNDVPGKKHFVDIDSDGQSDIIYFIDNATRHGNARQPLLVKIVDEDGDMNLTGEGDFDSDIYIADWYGDGTVDRVIDYVDFDLDNDVDEQYLYFFRNGNLNIQWVKDYGDDNRLWYNANYENDQDVTEWVHDFNGTEMIVSTQWLSDFNGDEMDVDRFSYDYKNDKLNVIGEIAFSFYDHDNDNYSEEVLRFSGAGNEAQNLRYSMDIDNDNANSIPFHHDYDLSLTSLGPINLPNGNLQNVTIRGKTTEGIIKWEDMRAIAKSALWNKIHLTWDENDNNIAPTDHLLYERWEGIINYGNEYMPRVGGPPTSPYNKRNEVDQDASGGMQFYYSPNDQRLHLYGAEVGWIKVDFDYDGSIDMVIWMEDSDFDGFFDTWKYDMTGDSVYERIVQVEDDNFVLYPFDYDVLHDFYNGSLDSIIDDSVELIEALKGFLQATETSYSDDSVEQYFNTDLINYRADFQLGQKIKDSQEGTRYYQDIIRERYWHRLTLTEFAQTVEFNEIKQKYENGEFDRVKILLERPVEVWNATYDSGGNDLAKNNFVDEIGNVYVTGISNKDNKGDWYTLKYNSSGSVLWNAVYDSGTSLDMAKSIVVDSSNNVYVTGWSYNSGNRDYYTIKYNSSGIELWNVTYDSGSLDSVHDITLDNSGYIYLTGGSNLTGDMDYYTIKYDSSGNKLLDMIYDSGNDDMGREVAVDSLGNIFVTGHVFNGLNDDFYTIKYNSTGSELWNATYDSGNLDVATGIAVDALGNIYVTGRSDNGVNLDSYTIKYDALGNEIWAVTYDGGNDDDPECVAVDDFGNIYVTGEFYFNNNFDYFTIKYNSSGNVLWDLKYDGGGHDYAESIALDSYGNIYLTGETHNGANVDYYTIKYSPIIS